MRHFAGLGHAVLGVDRNPDATAAVSLLGETICADIENGPWPFTDQTFDAVIVTHYLWRPLLPVIVQSVAPGGVLIYETFAAGHETVGKPSRPDFLLQAGELLHATGSLRTVAYEDGFEANPDRFVQRIVAVRPMGLAEVVRWPLQKA
jgi:SAM-dependent methyltransferase